MLEKGSYEISTDLRRCSSFWYQLPHGALLLGIIRIQAPGLHSALIWMPDRTFCLWNRGMRLVSFEDSDIQKNYIQSFRNEHKVNKQKIAEKCGVSVRTVEGWEQGRTIPIDSLYKLYMIQVKNLLRDIAENIIQAEFYNSSDPSYIPNPLKQYKIPQQFRIWINTNNLYISGHILFNPEYIAEDMLAKEIHFPHCGLDEIGKLDTDFYQIARIIISEYIKACIQATEK